MVLAQTRRSYYRSEETVSRYYVSLRGQVNTPTLIIIDSIKKTVIKTICLDAKIPSWVPDTKRGLTGLTQHKGLLYAATWDRVYIIDTKDHHIVGEITSPLFSDLHSVRVIDEEELWVASTNLDSLLKVKNGEVVERWSAWERPEINKPLKWIEQDFRDKTKHKGPYHYWHINDFFVFRDEIYATYLGRIPTIQTWLKKLRGIGKYLSAHKIGGLFHINRETGYTERVARLHGLHDFIVRNEYTYHLEFETNRLVKHDMADGKVTRIKLPRQVGLFARGLYIVSDDEILVGYSVNRDYYSKTPSGNVSSIGLNPMRVNWSIDIIGYSGIYSIIPFAH